MFDFNEDRFSEYKRTENPLFAWDMVLECCKEEKTFPGWVMDYLEDVAEELVNLSPTKKRAPEEIRDALGFKGKPFEQYRQFLDHGGEGDFRFLWSVYNRVAYERRDGANQTEAYKAAGKHFFGEDEQTENHWQLVRKCYLKFKNRMKDVAGGKDKN
ncbi:hypothetical protein DSCA_49040 [Desulfosarcina alkanivorans]|uniref:Uncharacterized protein n=1 Tax=Desulfosarcina alkanivorans TaxID=571177 RepID=A0A5K7YXF4_9BACT|nr:hypothetical protein [Desulfosarcina alkanivorans]BBO70974.1 hypothetical protein DSCA_49040 [Desulfosarcina alkanivorans]